MIVRLLAVSVLIAFWSSLSLASLKGYGTTKTQAPITIDYTLSKSLSVNQSYDMMVIVKSYVNTNPIHCQFEYNTAGLQLNSDEVILQNRQLGQANDFMLTITPRMTGTFYIQIHASVDTSNGVYKVIKSVPIMVGEVTQKPNINNTVIIDSRGERLQILHH